MSGLEVLGLVLGAFPLIVSALDKYKTGDTLIHRTREFETDWQFLCARLWASMGIHYGSVTQILEQTNLTEARIHELVTEASSEEWVDLEIEHALKTRLGRHYTTYPSMNEGLNKRTERLCKRPGLTKDFEPIWLTRNGEVDEKARRKFLSRWSRMTRALGLSRCQQILDEIDGDIEKLRNLASVTTSTEPMGADETTHFQSKHWQRMRTQAQGVFESLSSRLYPCSCNHSHQASLRLDIWQGAIIAKEREDLAARLSFLFTSFNSSCDPQGMPRYWKDIEVESFPSPTSQSSGAYCHDTKTISSLATNATKKRVQFAPSTRTFPSSDLARRLSSHQSTTSVRITDLCKALSQGPESNCCLGLLADQPWEHHVYSVPGPGRNNQISRIVSLKDLVSGSGSVSTRQKCALALALASSLLQLHDTSWLPLQWDTRDIYVLEDHSGDFLPFAYVRRTFAAAKRANRHTAPLIRNHSVFALGVALLELSYSAPLNDLHPNGGLSHIEQLFPEYAIASRLASQIDKRETPNYANALARCIKCDFGASRDDFGDEHFRRKYFESVVAPLRADWEYVIGG